VCVRLVCVSHISAKILRVQEYFMYRNVVYSSYDWQAPLNYWSLLQSIVSFIGSFANET